LEVKGNKLLCGITNFLIDSGIDVADFLKRQDSSPKFVFPFNAQKKHAVVVIDHPRDSSKLRILVQGSPDILIEACQFHTD